MGNQLKTILLLGVLTAILVWVGGIWGKSGAIIALVFALAINFFAYWFSDKMVLAMYRAKEVVPAEAPLLYNTVKELAMLDNLPMPKVYIYQSDNPNAFATGRDPNHAAVAVSTGIMELLSEQELKGVLAHELSHVKNRDILVATCAATLAAAITFIARMVQWGAMFGGGDRDRQGNALSLVAMLAMAILAPIAALLVQMAVSRSREYIADSGGAKLSGNPIFLANALRKLETAGKRRPMRNVNPATSHLFIVKPFSGRGLLSLFSTHPPVEERIARLENMII
ncbi:MAG: zinc metalloprotease HtpX [Candidatus Omnitrophica bacterium]|nr:zinc metalloprotease HtpX [Candidatus Omnitrophota bacterium]